MDKLDKKRLEKCCSIGLCPIHHLSSMKATNAHLWPGLSPHDTTQAKQFLFPLVFDWDFWEPRPLGEVFRWEQCSGISIQCWRILALNSVLSQQERFWGDVLNSFTDNMCVVTTKLCFEVASHNLSHIPRALEMSCLEVLPWLCNEPIPHRQYHPL